MQCVRRIPLREPAILHHADPVGDREGFRLVVRDEDRGVARAFQDVAQLEREPLARIDVEIRERLIEQQQFR